MEIGPGMDPTDALSELIPRRRWERNLGSRTLQDRLHGADDAGYAMMPGWHARNPIGR